MELLFKDLMDSTRTFGGKPVLIIGDFRKILPIVPSGSREQIVNASIKRSALFHKFKTLKLAVNMRLLTLRNDPSAEAEALQFPQYLLKQGEGGMQQCWGEKVSMPSGVNY